MATDVSASITRLHQPQAKTPAQRAKAYRLRKKAAASAAPATEPGRLPIAPTAATRSARVAPALLTAAALALATVGTMMNGWFSRSLGSSDVAGLMFLCIGMATDVAALVIPTCAAALWTARCRGTAAAAWAVWLVTITFAITSGIGFASINIADVTLSRASHVTPAVVTAQAALTDTMAARDLECGHGVGTFCRQREAAVSDRRAALDQAMAVVAKSSDPQSEAAVRIVAWVSRDTLRPTTDDFALLRLVLLALLPQFGGILLMVGRARA